MELAAAKLKEFSDDYTLNTNKPMELVFFKVSSMSCGFVLFFGKGFGPKSGLGLINHFVKGCYPAYWAHLKIAETGLLTAADCIPRFKELS